jgi:hypothetical protein
MEDQDFKSLGWATRPLLNQAAFRGLKAPAPSERAGARAKEEADSSAALRNDKPRGCGMTNKEQATARAAANTEILAAPE